VEIDIVDGFYMPDNPFQKTALDGEIFF